MICKHVAQCLAYWWLIESSINYFPVAFPYQWPALAHASDFPKISQTSIIWPWWALFLSLSVPRPGTSDRQPWFAAWPLLGTSKLNTSSSHLQIAVLLMPGGPGQNTGSGWSLGLYLLGAPEPVLPVNGFWPHFRTTQPPPQSDTLKRQTRAYSVKWVPEQLILHSDHSQSLQPMALGLISPIDTPTAIKAQLQQ